MLVGEIGFAEVNVHKTFLLGFLAIFSTMTNWFQSLYCILKESTALSPPWRNHWKLYSFIRTPFPASMQWLSEVYAVVFILKSLDQKKHHSMEITFWHIKGEGLWWKYWSTFMLGKTHKSHTMLSKKKNWFRAQATEKRGLLLWSTLKSNII